MPVDKRIPPPSGDVGSVGSVESSEQESTTTSTLSAASGDAISRVGAPRDFSGHADGTSAAYDSAEKWIVAALHKLGKDKTDILLPTFEPNDELCSQIHSIIAEWHTNRTIARDAGVTGCRLASLEKPPPQECLVKARGWLLRYINQIRAEKHISALADDKWGRKLAGVKADARAVNKKTKELKAESVRPQSRTYAVHNSTPESPVLNRASFAQGKLYHHKHDIAPSPEELMSMTYAGYCADQRVHAEVLDALEAGMAIGLYLPTGARGSELKKMHLQSLGHEPIRDEKSGLVFECLKLTAFETKTKEHHLNQILAHSNPWRCGVGLLGLSILVRVKLYGSPPFSMRTDEFSWKIIGSNSGTLDDRIKEAFKVAGVRRQLGDPITYLGRHFGTRLLQHAGGSAEGGAARRGHSNGTASFHYTECPLPDLLKLAGNDSDKPFIPAHHSPDLYPLADAVLLILFPELDSHEKYLDTRQKQVDAMRGGNADKVRTEEQLNDQQRLTRSIRFACRISLLCLVARPRTWKKWAILEDEGTIWQRATEANHRVIITLFAGNSDAIEAMNKLALAVRRAEEAEIAARLTSPDQAITNQVVSAISDIRTAAVARETLMLQQQQTMYQQLMSMVATNGDAPPPPVPLPLPPAEAAPTAPPTASNAIVEPTGGVRIKRQRESQDDVTYFSDWHDMGLALEYAKTDLVPREIAEGSKWRTIRRSDGRKDTSRSTLWFKYWTLAIAVGLLTRDGMSYDDAVKAVQARFDTFGAKPHTPFLKVIEADIKSMRPSDKDVLARSVLGF